MMSVATRCLTLVVFVSLGAASLAADSPARPKLRIVTLGDSITRGVRSGVTAEQTFASLLQAELQKTGAEAEVINVGIGGEKIRYLRTTWVPVVLATTGVQSTLSPGVRRVTVALASLVGK